MIIKAKNDYKQKNFDHLWISLLENNRHLIEHQAINIINVP